MKIHLSFFLWVILFQFCKPRQHLEKKYDVIIDYLLNDSLALKDTSEINYRLLKAYFNSDTLFIKKTYKEMLMREEMERRLSANDTCLRMPDLKKMNVDEVYRFQHNISFCQYRTHTTISKKGTDVELKVIISNANNVNSECKIYKTISKKLSAKEWDGFMNALNNSDFWGLKSKNNESGVDGQSIKAIGLINDDLKSGRPKRFQLVYRWGNSTLLQPLFVLNKLAGIQNGCYKGK